MTRVDGKDGAEESLPKVVQAVKPAKEGEGGKVSSAPVSPGKQSEPKPEPAPAADHAEVSKLLRSAVAGLSDKATRGFMTDETIEHLREKCPGWDLYALHADFERWVDADAARLPANWQKAFIGWVKRHHEKHKHELRG